MSKNLSKEPRTFGQATLPAGLNGASPARLDLASRLRLIARRFQSRLLAAPARLPVVSLENDGSANARQTVQSPAAPGSAPVDVDGFLDALGVKNRQAH